MKYQSLGKQINKMVYSLEKLNEENIEKQLLAKNAEITFPAEPN